MKSEFGRLNFWNGELQFKAATKPLQRENRSTIFYGKEKNVHAHSAGNWLRNVRHLNGGWIIDTVSNLRTALHDIDKEFIEVGRTNLFCKVKVL